MYNGIGLTTPRGSGTNGYVVRNLSALRTHDRSQDRASAWDAAPVKHREPDQSILEHEEKRKVEVKCLELQLELEDKGLDEDEIEQQVGSLRAELHKNLAALATNAKKLKPSDTHGLAVAKKAELSKMARALGTRSDYQEGEAFDREKQEEIKMRKMAEREVREKEKEAERARYQEQKEKWEAEKRERDRLRRREEDRLRKEREENGWNEIRGTREMKGDVSHTNQATVAAAEVEALHVVATGQILEIVSEAVRLQLHPHRPATVDVTNLVLRLAQGLLPLVLCIVDLLALLGTNNHLRPLLPVEAENALPLLPSTVVVAGLCQDQGLLLAIIPLHLSDKETVASAGDQGLLVP
ncbi:hypothetical protein H0H93_008385 [Arthromyces matolae]|nr:hypothetical protein H0H93_008385 [Arthromyces matolae]